MAPIYATIMCTTKRWVAILRRSAKRLFASPSSAGKIRKTPRPAPWRPRRARRVRTARQTIFAFCIVSAKPRASVGRRNRRKKELVAPSVAPRSHQQSHQIPNHHHRNGNGGEPPAPPNPAYRAPAPPPYHKPLHATTEPNLAPTRGQSSGSRLGSRRQRDRDEPRVARGPLPSTPAGWLPPTSEIFSASVVASLVAQPPPDILKRQSD